MTLTDRINNSEKKKKTSIESARAFRERQRAEKSPKMLQELSYKSKECQVRQKVLKN